MKALTSALVLLAAWAAAAEPASAPRRPNIVFFLVDDMGWQDTSVPFHTQVTELNRRYHTPNMERLAASGVKFTQAYAAALCSPTRVSLLTGMNAARHRVTNWTLRKDTSPDPGGGAVAPPAWNVNGVCTNEGVSRAMTVTPLPQLLHDAGYRTIHVGKAHFGAKGTPGEEPRNLGFDVNIAGHAAGGPGSYSGLHNFSAAWRTQPPDHIWDVPGLEAYHGRDINLTEALTLEAIKQVEAAAAARQPFYLYLAHYAVHAPFEPDTRFLAKYEAAGLKGHAAVYASMIESMDRSLGDVLDALERLGIAQDTVVLFASDNGSPRENPRNLPLRGFKITPYEGGIRVPMIVRWPGVTPAGTACASPVISEDWFPSLLEIGGTSWAGRVRQAVDGRSFVTLLRDPAAAVAGRDLVWHFPHTYDQPPYSALRRGDWKLIYQHATRKLELYDIAHDIGEAHDLSAAQPERVRELAAALGGLLRERGALMPVDRKTGQPVPWPDAAAQDR